jgi:hypothetical protein
VNAELGYHCGSIEQPKYIIRNTDGFLSAQALLLRHTLYYRWRFFYKKNMTDKLAFCRQQRFVTLEKMLPIFLSPDGMSLTKLSMAGNNLIFPGERESLVSDIPKLFPARVSLVGDIPVGDGKTYNIFLQCIL